MRYLQSDSALPRRLHKRACDLGPAFTLIELLTVIAIIAVLAVLAFPFIDEMQTRASQAKAVGNFRQLGAIFLLYTQDNNQQLPGPFLTVQRSGYRSGLAEGIGAKLWMEMGIPKSVADYQPVPLLTVPALKKWKYTKTDSVPGYPSAYTVIRNAPLPDGSQVHPFGRSGSGLTPAEKQPAKLLQVPNPSKTWAVYEAGGSGDPRAVNRMNFPDGPIHGKRRTVLFIDGHVETVPSDVTPADSSQWF
jgi:prepilin-type N-terminal cleavage/methylation domain-containing protein/prepilin-type processing-associated H-X9-DG protein